LSFEKDWRLRLSIKICWNSKNVIVEFNRLNPLETEFDGNQMADIRVIGSSTAFGAGVALEEMYFSILETNFQHHNFYLDARRAKNSNYLEHIDKQYSKNDSNHVYILHFRADELLKINRDRPSGFVLRKILNSYETYNKDSDLEETPQKRIITFILQFFLFCTRFLIPVVSGKKQQENYDFFLKMHSRSRLVIIILDSRRKFLIPLIPSCLRTIRSIRLTSNILKFDNTICVDYSKLDLSRNHFQTDKTHLNSYGHNILASCLIKIIGEIY
jgi:hypothetical protein